MIKGRDFIGITVVYFCHDGEQRERRRYVLNKRSEGARDEHGKWDCGGEAVQFGEEIEQTLYRGVLEEYGTNVLDFEFLGYRNVLREENEIKSHWLALDFLVQVDRNEVRNNEPDKFDKIGWFKKENFPEPLHSGFPECLRKYSDRL